MDIVERNNIQTEKKFTANNNYFNFSSSKQLKNIEIDKSIFDNKLTEEFMKKIIALAAALLSVSSFALSANDSWDTIKAEVKANPSLEISSGYSVFVGRIVTAFDVCVDGDNFNTLSQYPIYERKWIGGSKESDRYEDIVVGYEYLSFPISREVTRKVCRGKEDRNCKTVTSTETQQVVRDITVSKITRVAGRDRDDKKVELFSKTFEIPACL